MRTLPAADARRRSRALAPFLAGLLAGVMLTLATTVPADERQQRDPVAAVLYALSQLAVDTEQNARRIVDLSYRIEQLEEQIAEKQAVLPANP